MELAGAGDHIWCSPLDRGQLPCPVKSLGMALRADSKWEAGVSPRRICTLNLQVCHWKFTVK